MDGCIIIGDTSDCINKLIQSLHETDENFLLQDQGLIDKYLGVEIKQLDDFSFELTQPFLIERVTKFLGIDNGRTIEKLTLVPLKTKHKYWQNKLFIQIHYIVSNKHFIGTIW